MTLPFLRNQAVERYPTFEHDPLDTSQQSIRLISIDPQLSPEGLVQGIIHHTTIDAQYNCLSYRWGPTDLSHNILVNGKRLNVNKSLHEFLHAVRKFKYREPERKEKLYLRKCLWIDAICINQALNTEKNHQVAQMGKIYSNAQKVIMWLGKTGVNRLHRILDSAVERHIRFIFYNEYWARAWIAQEVLLAKDPNLFVADQLISLRHLTRRIRKANTAPLSRLGIPLSLKSSLPDEISAPGVLWAYMQHGQSIVREKDVFAWLHALQEVTSDLPHDRIYSLLALAEAGNQITVDYSTSFVELSSQVLMADSKERCLCEVQLVAECLQRGAEKFQPSDACADVQWKETTDSCSKGFGTRKNELIAKYGTCIGDGETMMRVPMHELAVGRQYVLRCTGTQKGRPCTPVKIINGLTQQTMKRTS